MTTDNNIIDLLKQAIKSSGKEEQKDKTPPKFRGTQHFVECFMTEADIEVSRDRFYFVKKKTKQRVKNIHIDLIKFWDAEKDRRNVSRTDAMCLISNMKQEVRDTVWNDTIKKVTKHVNDNLSELERLSTIVIKDTVEDYETQRMIFKTTLKVWLKNLKSKLLGINHRFPLIPVFWSYKGGTGKSMLVEHLISPFKPFTHGATLEDISNTEKNYKIFTEKMVIFCEELAGASKANIEAIKDAATRKTVQPRKFHSQDHEDEDCFSTMVFTSNSPVTKVMNDPANRRFVDIEVSNEIKEKELESIDFLKLIQSIDVDKTQKDQDDTRKDVDTYVMPFMMATKRKDFVEEFIESACIVVNADATKNSAANVVNIYSNFMDYYKYHGIDVKMRKDLFISELCARLGVKERRTNAVKRAVFIDLTQYQHDASIIFARRCGDYGKYLSHGLSVVK